MHIFPGTVGCACRNGRSFNQYVLYNKLSESFRAGPHKGCIGRMMISVTSAVAGSFNAAITMLAATSSGRRSVPGMARVAAPLPVSRALHRSVGASRKDAKHTYTVAVHFLPQCVRRCLQRMLTLARIGPHTRAGTQTRRRVYKTPPVHGTRAQARQTEAAVSNRGACRSYCRSSAAHSSAPIDAQSPRR